MSQSDLSSATARPSRWRAIIIGVLFSLPGFYFGAYGYQIIQGLSWGGTLQMGGIVTLFAVLLLTAVLGLASRRLKLEPSELLVIYAMTTVTIALGGGGMLGFLIPTLPAAHYYATPENQWESFLDYMPSWLTVNDHVAVETFYEAGGTLYSLATLRAWAAPLGFWLLFATLLVLGT